MGCHDPSEDVEDDGTELVAAAGKGDDMAAARLLLRLSRPETFHRRRQLQPTVSSEPPLTEDEGAPVAPQVRRPLMTTGRTWGRRGRRSRPVTTEGVLSGKGVEASRGSPTTPLSWSGGSGTSGSVCGGGCSTPPRPPKLRKVPSAGEPGAPRHVAPRRKPELWYGGQPIPSPAVLPYDHGGATRTTDSGAVHEGGEPQGAKLGFLPPPAGHFAVSGSNKAVEVAAATPAPAWGPGGSRSAVQVDLLRWRLTGERSGSVFPRRQGQKKKTVAELRVLEESMLEEQEELRKELEQQKQIYHSLLEENMKLKKLESNLAPDVVSKPPATPVACEGAKPDRPRVKSQTVGVLSNISIVPEQGLHAQLPPTNSPVSPPQRTFLLDLNCLPDECNPEHRP